VLQLIFSCQVIKKKQDRYCKVFDSSHIYASFMKHFAIEAQIKNSIVKSASFLHNFNMCKFKRK